MQRNRIEQPEADIEAAAAESSPLRFEDKLLLQSYTLLIIHAVLQLVREHEHGSIRAYGTAAEKDPSLFTADIAHMIEEKLARSLRRGDSGRGREGDEPEPQPMQ